MKRPSAAIVVAMAENRVIGRDGRLPWRLPADLTRFRVLTMGKPIIMGRRTHESIGRILDGRRNIVVSRRPDFRAPGCVVAPSLDAAFEAAAAITGGESGHLGGRESESPEVMVIGGASIYEHALPFSTRIHLTLVHATIDGDVRFPELEPGAWREVSCTAHGADTRNRYAMSFVELARRDAGEAGLRGNGGQRSPAQPDRRAAPVRPRSSG